MATNPQVQTDSTAETIKKLQAALLEKDTDSSADQFEALGSQIKDRIPSQTSPTELQTHQEQKPGAFIWESQRDRDLAWEKWLNREAFSYDLDADPLYQQYKQQYMNTGQLAMQDAMGQVAALTGGYGSSYAQTAGQQAYQGYLQQLNDVVPELYGAAYDRYQAEGETLYNEALAYETLRQQAYKEYQDEYDRWYTERDYLTAQQSTDQKDLMDLIAMGYEPTDAELTAAGLTREQAQAAADYSKNQQSTGYKELMDLMAMGYVPTYAELTAAGMTQAQAQAVLSYYKAQQSIGYNDLLDLMAMGYVPTNAELTAAGLTQAQAQAAVSDYQKEQQATLRKDLLDLMKMGYAPTDEELAAAGVTRQQAQTISDYYKAMNTST